MRAFLLNQMDYILFIYGFVFVLLFSICVSLPKQQKIRIPWNYLGFFGLIHGINEWLDMLALSLGDSGPFKWIRILIMVASFICLLEFGRLTCERLKYARIGWWIYVPLFLAVFSEASSGGILGVNAAVRYSFGLVGGLWAALALWRISKENKDGAWPMTLAAVAMAVYAVAAGFIVPKDGFAVQLLRGLVACVIAVMVWNYHEELRAEKVGSQVLRHEKKVVAAMALAFLLTLAIGWGWAELAGEREAAAQRTQLLNVLQQTVTILDPELAKGLTGSAADLESPAYQTLKVRLQHLHKAMASVRFIYLMRRVEGKVVFLVDSETSGSKDESPPGQVYDEASPKIYDVFASGKGVVDDPTTDRWGTWISAYAPLNDGRTGELIAVLGVDQSAHDFNLAVAVARFKGIVLGGLICLIAMCVFVYWRTFVLALEQSKKGRKIDLLSQWGIPVIVALLGATLTIALFLELRQGAWNSFQAAFMQRAISRAQSVSQELERQLDRLDGLRRLLDAQGSVGRSEFGQYVAPILKGVPIRALEWIPRVAREESIFYESSARQDGVEGFRIYEKDALGKTIPALERDQYFPVYYLEPLSGNETALGFDLASEPVRRAAMDKSRDTGQAVATAPLVLVQAGQKKTGVLVFMPVYDKDLPRNTVAQRRKSLKGFVLAVYNADEFLKGIYSKAPPEGLACLIEDLEAPADSRVLYRHVIRLGAVDWKHPLLKYEMSLEMPDRQWRMTIVPGTAFIERNLSYAYWLILPIGLFLTVLLAAFLNFLATARYRAESLVELRTKELFNEKEALQRSREEVRLILDSAAEAIYGIDKEGKCVFCNPACVRILGYKDPGDLVGRQMHNLIHHTGLDGKPLDAKDCPLLKAYSKGEPFHSEERFWKADGSGFFAEVWAHSQWRDGEVVGSVVTFVDITERKLSDDALRASKERFDEMAELSREVIFEVDAQGFYTYVSHVCGQVYGYTREELVGKKYFYDLFPAEGRKKMLKEIFGSFERKESFKDFPNSIIHRDGREVLLSTNAAPMLDQGGNLIGYRGVDRDITAAKNAEEALRESEERYRLIASAITDYIYTVRNEEGRPVSMNPACLAVTGYSADEFSANRMLWINMVVEEDRYIVLRQIDEIFSGQKEVGPVEHRIIHKDGRIRWVKNTVVLRHDAEGRLLAYDGLIGDITARREAEKILEDQKRALDEHAIVSKADAQGRITYVNDKFCEISKHSREELIGQNHRIVNAGYHPKAFFANLWRTISSGQVWQGKIRNRAKDGSFYWVQSTIVPFTDEHGHIKEYISARTDITQNIENEERLEQAMQVKSNFVSTVSHELRTPLASIKSSIDILNTEAPGKLTDDQKTFLGRVKSNIDRLARLINDVLDLSKLESGKMSMHFVPLRPEEMVKDVVEIQRAVAKGKTIALETKFENDLPVLSADKDRLTQVLNNLINNALKFTNEGKITVEVSCGDRKTMKFCVRDTGLGIKREDLAKLFQKFQQVGGLSHQVSGTGLGLAISKEIVERHGGRVWAESELGKGSTFIFTIPVKHKRRILVVDDDQGALETIKGALEGADQYEVELASDGFMAGQKYLEFLPHLIILDIGLPKLSGLDVCSQIKRDPKTMATKIIMLSSFTEDLEKKAWKAGADEILRKPVDARELLLKVKNLV